MPRPTTPPPRRVTARHQERHFDRIGRRLSAAEAALENARDALGRLARSGCESRKARNTAAWLVACLAHVVDDLHDATDAHERLRHIAAGSRELADLDQL
jgi:hypothetical protein